MKEKKQKKHSFLKHPILAAVVLPIIGLFGSQIVGFFVAVILHGLDIQAAQEDVLINSQLPEIILALLFIWIMKRSYDNRFKFGFEGRNLKQSILFSCWGLIIVVINIVPNLASGAPITLTSFLLAITGGLAPGLFEEVCCRGVVLSNMMAQWRSGKNRIYASLLASSVVFGLIHLLNIGAADAGVTLVQVLYATGLGIFFGAVYLRTRNLWGTVIVHSLIDFGAKIFTVDTTAASLTADAIILGAAIFIVYGAIGLYLARPAKHTEIEALWNTEPWWDEAVSEAETL